MKKHDENQDVRILSKKFNVNSVQKQIRASHTQDIGNKTWGRIDFLTHYCGYTLIWGDVILTKRDYEDSERKDNIKKIKKESKHQLSDKTKKSNKR